MIDIDIKDTIDLEEGVFSTLNIDAMGDPYDTTLLFKPNAKRE